jgi:transketolase C-terminal domain/subunit
VKPLDEPMLGTVFAESRPVVTLEEHSTLGGFGGAVAEWLSEQATPRAKLLRQGTHDRFLYDAGEQEHARQCYGLTNEAVSDAIRTALAGLR